MRRIREKSVPGLSADEVRILELMRDKDADKFWTDRAEMALRSWFAQAILSDVASGCVASTLRRALPPLPKIARDAIIELRRDYQGLLDEKLVAPAEAVHHDRGVVACDQLIARLKVPTRGAVPLYTPPSKE